MAPSPPSIVWRAVWSSALGKGGTDKACPPHNLRSWQRHQGAAFILAPKSSTSFRRAGDLILSVVRMEDPGARLASSRAHGPAGVSPSSPGEGVARKVAWSLAAEPCCRTCRVSLGQMG